jgi:hypothetical protein
MRAANAMGQALYVYSADLTASLLAASQAVPPPLHADSEFSLIPITLDP